MLNHKLFNTYIKNLNIIYLRNQGKNNKGIITVKNKGNGFKIKYIIKDNKKFLYNIPGILIKIFNKSIYRNKFYGLFLYSNGLIIIHSLIKNMKIGDLIINHQFSSKLIKGNSLPLINLDNNTLISNIELLPGLGSKFCKSSGTFGLVFNKYKFNNRVVIKLKSNNFYLFNSKSLSTVGVNFFLNKKLLKKKAGINRWLNIKPHVRGTAMNPIDHPHGGGQGKTSGGRCSVTPYGKLTKGKKTKKTKNKFYLTKYV